MSMRTSPPVLIALALVLPVWLYRIARQTALSCLRTQYAEQALFRREADSPEAQDTGRDPSFDDAEQFHYGLHRISLLHREVPTWFFLQDLSLEEIAATAGGRRWRCSRSDARARYSHRPEGYCSTTVAPGGTVNVKSSAGRLS